MDVRAFFKYHPAPESPAREGGDGFKCGSFGAGFRISGARIILEDLLQLCCMLQLFSRQNIAMTSATIIGMYSPATIDMFPLYMLPKI